MSKIVEIRPRTDELQVWQGDPERNVLQPMRLRTGLGRDMKYQVAIEPDRLKELADELGKDLSLQGSSTDSHPFWDDDPLSKVTLHPKTNVFDITNPVDEVRLGIAKAHPYVAMDLEDAANRPETKFVIYSREDDAKKKASRIYRITEAVNLSSKLTATEKVRLIHILEGRYLHGSSNETIDVAIHDLANNSPEEFLRWAKEDPEVVAIRALLLRAKDDGYVRKVSGRLMFGDVQLGLDIDEAVSTLMHPDFIDIQTRIREKLEALS